CCRVNGVGFEPIAFALDCFDELRVPGTVSEGGADFSNGGIDAVVRVEVEAVSPEALDDFIPADQFSIFADEQDKQIHWDAFQVNHLTSASQLVSIQMQHELPELYAVSRHRFTGCRRPFYSPADCSWRSLLQTINRCSPLFPAALKVNMRLVPGPKLKGAKGNQEEV